MANLNTESIEDKYFQNENGSIKAYVKRNQEFNRSHYSRVLLYFQVPKKAPHHKSPLPDFYFAIRIQEFNPGPPEKSGKPYDENAEPPLKQTVLFTFGDLAYADQFLIPQEKDASGRVALTNIQRKLGLWLYPEPYQTQFQDTLNLPLKTFFYSINNIYGGCATFCQGATALLPQEIKDSNTTGYALMLWITDSQSPNELRSDRSYTTMNLDIGYIDDQGYFRVWSEWLVPSLQMDWSSQETEYDYKKRKRKEQQAVLEEDTSNDSKLSQFFSTLTNEKNS